MTSADTQGPVKVGIAGLGRSGWGIHARAIAELPDQFAIVAVCDPIPARRDEAQERFGCRVFSEYAALVAQDDIELMVVATPSHLHAGDSIHAMHAGKHVLVEKPMAPDLAQVDAMIAAADETGRILTVNQNYRYSTEFQKIKQIVESGVLGRILQIRIAAHSFARRWDWQTLKRFGGGLLNNHGAHVIDWATLLFDDPDPWLFCHMQATPLYAGDADSHVKIIMRPHGGPLVDIELTVACAYPQDKWLIMGTQGSLAADQSAIRWKYFEPDQAPPLILDTEPTPDRTYNREELPWHEEKCDLDRNFVAEMLQLYRDLHATLAGSGPLVITPESVRRQVAILERCRELSPV